MIQLMNSLGSFHRILGKSLRDTAGETLQVKMMPGAHGFALMGDGQKCVDKEFLCQ
jgi:hypothetical protein